MPDEEYVYQEDDGDDGVETLGYKDDSKGFGDDLPPGWWGFSARTAAWCVAHLRLLLFLWPTQALQA
jgi:hypothetical protein